MTRLSLAEFVAKFPEFQASSWDAWRRILARITPAVREFYAIVGRGAGKSRIASVIAVYFAGIFASGYRLVAGENLYIGIFAPDRKQARVTLRYVIGFLRALPKGRIVAETQDSIELQNGVIIEVVTASTAAPRGRSYCLAIIEEAAFLPTDQSANPDVELLRALRPALARVPGSLLVVISSPYARRGILWEAWRKYHDTPDSDVVFVQGPTLALNPLFDAEAVAKAHEDDPVSAAAEYGAQFRSDVEGFVSVDVVTAVVVPGRHELPAEGDEVAVVDVAGGSGTDSFAYATARAVGETRILTAVREIRPPFSPEAAVADCVAFLKQRGISRIVGDKYAGEWPREQFRKHGITYIPAKHTKSDFYRELLPLLNSGRVELLDHPRLVAQLLGLERRVARGGKDSIDHGPHAHAHDDVVNAVAGALVLTLRSQTLDGFMAFIKQQMGQPAFVVDVGAAEAPAHLTCRLKGLIAIDAATSCCKHCGTVVVAR